MKYKLTIYYCRTNKYTATMEYETVEEAKERHEKMLNAIALKTDFITLSDNDRCDSIRTSDINSVTWERIRE